MNRETVTLMANKKTIDLKPQQMVVYRSCKIIEAVDRNDACYYLYMYKNKPLNGIRAKHIKLGSFLHRALARGISFSGTHPLTLQVLSDHPSFRSISFNQLYKKIAASHSPLETAYILTLFDSFAANEPIHKLLKNTYYKYRRNGQMLLAYKTLNIFADFAPEDAFARDMQGHLDFQRYRQRYADVKKVASSDPQHFERVSFDRLTDPETSRLLLDSLHKQNRLIDEIAVRLHLLTNRTIAEDLIVFDLIEQHFDQEQQLQFYRQLAYSPELPAALGTQLLEKLLESQQPDAVVQLLTANDIQPSDVHKQAIADCFAKADLSIFPPLFSRLNHRLLDLFSDQPQLLEPIVIRCISAFFRDYDLDTLKQWLEAFQQQGIHLPIEQKLNKMQQLEEDPEQQGTLGELYLYFHQPEKSIDCFKWEMELKPEDPKPVHLLSKVYLTLGNKDEAAVYQQLYLQMQR
ncbi:hypothetical protein ERJ70_02805 [Sediminibacillus dalangtanensis]|uniref:Uncharacterized protein n=1 Tax=Sediminibacillus dalangtanensis TaxID=2729421 RepID=A0ABX7VND5_9BACI|nr:hypothetical protein [Sediminibacillus dalangtanensis]QTM98339.1 hypothetical protein ERJ70_02805 [Sediminibacillus dalangtanensis]